VLVPSVFATPRYISYVWVIAVTVQNVPESTSGERFSENTKLMSTRNELAGPLNF
jgi:hypothetical protein